MKTGKIERGFYKNKKLQEKLDNDDNKITTKKTTSGSKKTIDNILHKQNKFLKEFKKDVWKRK